MSSLLIDTIPKDSDFSLRNLPFGVFSTKHQPRRRCCTRVGDTLLDLSILHEAGLLIYTSGLDQATLNVFLEQPRKVWLQVRSQLIDLLTNEASAFNTNVALREAVLQHMDETVTLHLPITVGDYTDFYSSREHATNVGYVLRYFGMRSFCDNFLNLLSLAQTILIISSLNTLFHQHHVSR
jgi:fumarylacetoacetase